MGCGATGGSRQVKETTKTQKSDQIEATQTAEAPRDPDLVPRALTQEERHEAWRAANFHNSSSGHERPIALWLLGPSSVGKSTLTAQAGPKFGIPLLSDRVAGDSQGRAKLDAVLIDGEFVRDAYGVWQKWTKTDDWRSAYPALKSTINKEKDQMFTEAGMQRKHLVIPQTLLNLQKGLDEVEALIWQGYTNHVVAIVAPLDECQKRGQSRELTTGKRYKAEEFERSISAIPAMIMACNGRYEVVRAVVRSDSLPMEYDALSTGDCGNFAENAKALLPFREEELHDVIDHAINRKSLPPLPVDDADDAALGIVCGEPQLLRMHSTASRASTPSTKNRAGSKMGVHLPRTALDASRMPRPFHDDERKKAWTAANFYNTSSDHSTPVALWILGPSSVGKSTLTAQLGAKFNIPSRADTAEHTGRPDPRLQLDAVVVDGEFMRDAYGVWQLWMQSPERQFAYRVLKSTINKEKGVMCAEAISKRKHFVVPQTMLNLQQGLTEIEELTRRGYVNHVAAVLAPLEWCKKRGCERENCYGKEYRPEDYEHSLAAIVPMILACNGRFEIGRATFATPEMDSDGSSQQVMTFQTLAGGLGGAACQSEDVDETCAGKAPNSDELQAIIDKAIGRNVAAAK